MNFGMVCFDWWSFSIVVKVNFMFLLLRFGLMDSMKGVLGSLSIVVFVFFG